MTLPATDDVEQLLLRLLEARVDFVVVGGIAAALHGSEQLTKDLDILVMFTVENMTHLMAALRPLRPRNSARPDLGEIQADPAELARYRNLYLVTDLGRLDVLGELPPLGGYAEVAAAADRVELFGATCKVISLDHLITVKEAVGRPKDLLVAAELRAIRDRLRNPPVPRT
ncbi:MAG TPA: hypothetical protein VIK91_19235 [Nannocystis sp.]